MAIPLPVPTRQQTGRPIVDGHSSMSGANLGLYSPLSSSINMNSQYGNSCALTILRGDADHPIHPHAPIHQKQDPSKGPNRPQQQSRFATSFANLRSASKNASSGFDSSVRVHAISDAGILLPFLDRPAEVKELLFETKANEALMYRLCRVFGGDPERPTQRGLDERWDEMLELLIELDRPLLDDEDWLVRLESLVMERSPELWAQLARCLGAEGLTLRPAAGQPSSSRFDSWALPSTRDVNASHLNDSPLSPPSDNSSEDGDSKFMDRSMSVSVEPLDALPQSYSEQPAGKMHKSTLRDSASPAASPMSLAPEPASRRSSGQASPGEVFALSAGGDESAFPASLEDIMEEPGSSTEAGRSIPRRTRSQSGKYAGLRISAMTSSSPASDSFSASIRRDSSSSPLPTGTMSPAGLAPTSREQSPNRTTSTSFSKHRRLSVLVQQNNPVDLHHNHDKVGSAEASPKSSSLRRQRGVSEATQSLNNYSFPSQPRHRAQSFARSFAELKSPSEHLEQLRAENAKAEADRLAENTRRMSLKDPQSGVAASAPPASSGGLGLHRDSCSSSGLLDPSAALAAKVRRASAGRKRSASKGDGSSTGSTSPPIPGLLPDGRTRHPSGSFGSRDLSESIAAFRANMGLSISPAPSENNFSEAGASETGSATRKRKGSGGAELPKPTSRTANTAEAKISRKGSPPTTTTSDKQNQAQFEQPKHMKDIQSRQKSAGSSGSGLALGGGFSLAKSGANFRRQSHDGTPASPTGWKSSFSRRDAARTRGDPYSFRSPPPVHRRPGGFASLAQEYEKARHGRRTSESVFSISSNALESSPSSSIASFDTPGESMSPAHRLTSDDSVPHLFLTSEAGETKPASAATPGDPTPTAGPSDGITPRPSFSRLASGSQGYPFPNLLHRMASTQDAKSPSAGPATPLSPLQACHTRLSPSPNMSGTLSGSNSPRSPSIVFPISPSPSISRAKEFQKALHTSPCQQAFERIKQVSGNDAAEEIKELITKTERTHLHDEALLEQVGKRLGLVDHERARQVGGKDAEEADIALAEEGYQQRWECFAELCKSLGVGQYELGMAKRRCGPAIDLCGQTN